MRFQRFLLAFALALTIGLLLTLAFALTLALLLALLFALLRLLLRLLLLLEFLQLLLHELVVVLGVRVLGVELQGALVVLEGFLPGFGALLHGVDVGAYRGRIGGEQTGSGGA